MMTNYIYLYLLAPLHTGGITQEGNLLGIARETHTNLPYIPSSTIRGKLRSMVKEPVTRLQLFGPELQDLKNGTLINQYEQITHKKLVQLEQGDIWVGDGLLLWLPVSSLSHGVIWISCPMLLRRWRRFYQGLPEVPIPYHTNLEIDGSPVYLKDAILPANELHYWSNWQDFLPKNSHTEIIDQVLIISNQHFASLVAMSLWRQVKIKLDQYKSVEGGFRYEEAIPPDTLMYFPWGITSQANGSAEQSQGIFQALLSNNEIIQIGGQESLGRGFVQQW